MINNSTIFSILRKSDKNHWTGGIQVPSFANDFGAVLYQIRTRLEKLKSNSLWGLNDDCLSIVPFKEFLQAKNNPNISYYVWIRKDYNPPIVISLSSSQAPTIFHIGAGLDMEDKKFELYRPGKLLNIPLEKLNTKQYSQPILPNFIIRIDCRPKDTGGPGHYFFYKLPRDLRVACNNIFE